MLDDANSTATSEQILEVISNLTVVTSPEETLNTSLFPQDLNTTTMVVGVVLDFIVEKVDTAEPGELLPFYDVHIHVQESAACRLACVLENQIGHIGGEY